MSVLRFIDGKTFGNIGIRCLWKPRNANLSVCFNYLCISKTLHLRITVRSTGVISHRRERPRSTEIV
jgi:hypothetical protein